MTNFLRTHLTTATVALATASALLMAAQGAVAAPADTQATQAAHAEHAARMQLIGRTARFDELPAAPVAADAAASGHDAWAARTALAGRTARFDEVAPAAVAADREPATEAELVQAYTQRMQLIGRTVPANELATVRQAMQQRAALARSDVAGS
ncbi:hypothetical protein [Rhizobacter sp. Root1221]|uniref:hypothetical protein n=1 Tax=Rhizobacter sp. Root1221 TaxID=1736433 RepID=UPI0006F8537A|nr:hypothetical protein [Rhizobacter sp. Root1221]KQV91749.1 hypothetical protein ASC87_06660 [Rhizobacter sp. Root1221]